MELTKIGGDHFYKMMINASNKLEADKEYINSLNVFPVPDGDTGTNMSLTFKAAVIETEKSDKSRVGSIARNFSKGALLGARGNSGVILSQILRGISSEIIDKEYITTEDFTKALEAGTSYAYKAVMRPTEGTILTIIKAAAEGAKNSKKTDFAEFFNDVCKYATKVLEMTPDMLPVLKKAKVVDAGGMGLVVLLKGMRDVFKDNPEKQYVLMDTKISSEESNFSFSDYDDVDIKFGYCTEFIITTEDIDTMEFRNELEKFGDSIVVVSDEEIVKVHVHTNDPGRALSMATEKGTLSKIKIENMREQHSNLVIDSKEDLVDEYIEEKEYAFVAVSPGDGITDVFKDLGVDVVIGGGQTMNPSTNDIVEAFKNIHAKNIFVYPNNKNIIMAAEQAKEISDRNVIVIPTKTIPQALSSIVLFDESESVEENIKNMLEGMKSVKTVSITKAVRQTEINGKDIDEGDTLGLVEGDILFSDKDGMKLFYEIIDSIVTEDSEFMTVFYGTEFEYKDELESIEEKIQSKYEDLEITFIDGKQPVYSVIIGVE